MAVKVTKRIYNEIYTEGETDWLLGNVGEWQKLRLTCEVAIEFFATQQSPVQINSIENSFENASGERWGDFGFDNGMTLVFEYTFEQDTTGDGEFDFTNTVQQNFEILNISGSTMEVSGTIDSQGFENVPTNFGSKKITDVRFFVDQDLEGCRISYQHLTNEDFETTNLNSFIDGTENEFILPNFESVSEGVFVNMEAIGLQSGMAIRQAKVRKLGVTSSEDEMTFDIPQSQNNGLVITNFFNNTTYQSIRSTKLTVQNQEPGFQTSISDGFISQQQFVTGNPIGANQNQCFLYDSPTGSSKDMFFSLNFRITGTNFVFGTSGLVRLSVLRFTNGSQFDFVERITLREWNSPASLINQTLSFNGVKLVTYSQSDSLVLAVEFFGNPTTFNSVGITYQWTQGFLRIGDPGSVGTGTKRKYEFEIEYMIPSIFDSVNNFQDISNLVPPSYLQGDGSLTDNFDIKFYPEWNNPNVIVKNELSKTARKGNTGWYNENFNQLNNDFEIESVQYFDENGNPVDSLDYSSKTKVKITIGGVTNLNTNTECGFGFCWIPTDESDYTLKETPFHQNVFVHSGSLDDGFSLDLLYPGAFIGFGNNGASMDSENVKFTNLNGKIIFETTFNPNPAFFNLFDQKDDNDKNFIIWVSVADGELERNFSDRVSLLADYGQMVKNIPPAGAYSNLTNSFIEHPYSDDVIGVDEYKGIVQDDVLCRIPFKIPNDGSESFQSMTFGIEAFNISENRRFELEKYNLDLTQYPVFNNTQEISIDQIRGFKLESGNNKNWVKINRDNDADTSLLSAYVAFYAFKIRWEDWIQNPDAPTDFFDVLKENKGLNNDWIDYLRTTNWKINFFVEIVSSQNGELVEYRNQFPFTFKDYDENQNVQVEHKYYRNSDNTLLNIGTDPETGKPLGVILSNEATRIEISFEILDSGIWDLSNTYSVTTIEIDRGAGILEQRQLSSVWGSEGDNPLKPLPNETKLKMEVDGTQKVIKTTCLVDPDLLENAVRYRITGRIGCGSQDVGTINGLYEFRYEDTYE